jgi:hypothetical protein
MFQLYRATTITRESSELNSCRKLCTPHSLVKFNAEYLSFAILKIIGTVNKRVSDTRTVGESVKVFIR